MRGRKSKGVIVAVAVVLAAAALIAASRHYDVRAQMDRVVVAVRDRGPLPFFVAMAVLPAIGFPLSAFTLIAGPVFGPTMGVGMVVVCGTLAIAANVALAYWVAALALHPVADRLVRWLGYRLPDISSRSAWSAILVLRLIPLTPFFLQSVVLGLARVPFGPYMLVSVLVPSAYAAAIITLGDALMRGDRWAMAAAGALFLIIGTVLHFVRKRLPKSVPPAPPRDDQRS